MITEAEVGLFLKEYEDALGTGSFENVERMIHPDAMFRFNDGDYQGIDEIKAAFERTWAYDVEDERYWLSDVEVRTLDVDSASITFQFHWSGTGEDGPFQIDGRGTMVVVRECERLKIVVEHLSR